MTREEYEDSKRELVANFETEIERLGDAASVSYDSEDNIKDIIEKAECDLELIKSQIRDIEDALSELRSIRNTRIEE